MKDLTLDLNQRQHIRGIVAQQEGRASDIVIFARLLEKLKLSEAEEALIKLEPILHPVTGEDTGGVSWRPVPPGIDPTVIQVEDGDAAKLKNVLDNWPRFAARDSEWLYKVLPQL